MDGAALLLHGDQSEGVGHGADEDDCGEERAEEADHGVEDLFPAERGLAEQDLLFDAAHACDPRDEQADRNGRDGHHDGICQKIKEIQQLHADDLHARQRPVAERGQTAEHQHHDADDGRRFFPAPAELVLEGRHGALRQRDGARQRGEQHQQEKQNADGRPETHGVEDLRDRDEHERRARLQRVGVAAREREHGGNNHESCHNGDGRVENLHIAR